MNKNRKNRMIVWRKIHAKLMSLNKLKDTHFLWEWNMGKWPSGSSLYSFVSSLLIVQRLPKLFGCLYWLVWSLCNQGLLMSSCFLSSFASVKVKLYLHWCSCLCLIMIKFCFLEMGFFCYLLIALFYEVFVSQWHQILYLIKNLLNLDHKKRGIWSFYSFWISRWRWYFSFIFILVLL